MATLWKEIVTTSGNARWETHEGTVPGSEGWPIVHKARAIIPARPDADQRIGADYQILVAQVGNLYMLPGGKLEPEETTLEAVIREVDEEIGATVEPVPGFTHPILRLWHYQEGYARQGDPPTNRVVETVFWMMQLVNSDSGQLRPHLSESELLVGVQVQFMSLGEIERQLDVPEPSAQPKKFFDAELREVLRALVRLDELRLGTH